MAASSLPSAPPPPPPGNPPPGGPPPGGPPRRGLFGSATDTATVIYILYLAGLLFPITLLIGVILAYIERGEDGSWMQSHYRFQIRTFWIGLLMTVVGGVLALVLVGWLLLLFWLVWLVVRCVKGMKYLNRREPVPDPATWGFG